MPARPLRPLWSVWPSPKLTQTAEARVLRSIGPSETPAVREGHQMVTKVSAEGYTGVRSSDELRGEYGGF